MKHTRSNALQYSTVNSSENQLIWELTLVIELHGAMLFNYWLWRSRAMTTTGIILIINQSADYNLYSTSENSENAHFYFSLPKLMSSETLVCPINSPKPREIQFTVTVRWGKVGNSHILEAGTSDIWYFLTWEIINQLPILSNWFSTNRLIIQSTNLCGSIM